MKCSHCKAENPADAKFCGSCGKAIEQKKADSSLDDVLKWIGVGAIIIIVLIALGA